jgi:hypothetical protein
MVKIIATNAFSRWMKRAGIRDVDLLGAVAEMSRGLIDANLGGDVYKKRFGVAGRGKRGGARTIVATRKGDRWIFLFGFEKNERSNIRTTELIALQKLAKTLLDLHDRDLARAVAAGELKEIEDGHES